MTQVVKGYKDNYSSNYNSWSRNCGFDFCSNNYRIPKKRVRFDRWVR